MSHADERPPVGDEMEEECGALTRRRYKEDSGMAIAACDGVSDLRQKRLPAATRVNI